MRLNSACEVVVGKEREGVTAKQEKLLRSRKRDKNTTNIGGQTEEEKWRKIYAILFPDDNIAKMPSPYYDIIPVRTGSSTVSPSADIDYTKPELEIYEEFVRKELPPLVRYTLEKKIDAAILEAGVGGTMGIGGMLTLGGITVEEQLKQQLVSIVTTAQLEILSAFKKTQGEAMALAEIPVTSIGSAQTSTISEARQIPTPSTSSFSSKSRLDPDALDLLAYEPQISNSPLDHFQGVGNSSCDSGNCSDISGAFIPEISSANAIDGTNIIEWNLSSPIISNQSLSSFVPDSTDIEAFASQADTQSQSYSSLNTAAHFSTKPHMESMNNDSNINHKHLLQRSTSINPKILQREEIDNSLTAGYRQGEPPTNSDTTGYVL